MSSSKGWLESQIEENHIKYFDYAEFSDLTVVGEGGSGSVCKADWKNRRMTVALKFFKSDANSSNADKSVWEEFVREVNSIIKIRYVI